MSPEDLQHPVDGPFGKGHMKGMVQRNALENAACEKVTRHLENQKKAFVKQNTRDEEDMRTILYRLQLEQQTTLTDNTIISEDGDQNKVRDFDEFQNEWKRNEELIVNPYPVTIIPRFEVTTKTDKAKNSKRPDGSTSSRYKKKSVEYDDAEDSCTFSGLTSSGCCVDRSNIVPTLSFAKQKSGGWLASPNAISSVRRMRKSVLEQAQYKVCRKLSSEQQNNLSHCPTSSMPHKRQNSLKDKTRQDLYNEELSSPRSDIVGRRRACSLQERNSRNYVSAEPRLTRSYTVLTKSTATEYRQNIASTKVPSNEYVPLSSLSLGKNTERNLKILNSKKTEK